MFYVLTVFAVLTILCTPQFTFCYVHQESSAQRARRVLLALRLGTAGLSAWSANDLNPGAVPSRQQSELRWPQSTNLSSQIASVHKSELSDALSPQIWLNYVGTVPDALLGFVLASSFLVISNPFPSPKVRTLDNLAGTLNISVYP